ncbi:MAG: DUF4974 domain-containing protein [Thermoguttaceae bacterium]
MSRNCTSRIVLVSTQIAAAGIGLVMLALFAAALEAGETGQARTPEKTREIFVPFGDLNVLLENQPERVLLSREAYDALVEKAQESPKTRVPRAAVLLSADYAATAQRQRVQMTGNLAIEVLEKGLHAVPLDLAGVGLLSAKLDGRDAPIGRDPGGRLSLFVEGLGRHVLTLDMTAPLESTAAQQVLQFRLPRPPAAKLTLAVPGDVEIKSGADVSSRTMDQAAGVTRFELLPRPGDTTVVMSLNSHLQRRDQAVAARSVLVDEVTSAYERLHATVSLAVLHRAVDRFRFAVPEGFEITDIQTPLLARWDVETIEGRRIANVRLREQTAETVVIGISAIKSGPFSPLPPAAAAGLGEGTGARQWQMPRLEPLDVVGQVAIVGVLAEERLKAELLAADGLIPIDTAVLSRAMPETAAETEPGRPSLRAIAAYYAPQADFRLAVRFDAPPPEMAVTANTLLMVGDDGCQVRGGLAMMPEVEKRFTFDLSVPPGWTVVNVTGPEDKPLAFERHASEGKPGRIRVYLGTGIPAGKEYRAYFHAVYTPPGWLAKWKSNKFPVEFPRFAVIGASRDEGGIGVAAHDDLTVRPQSLDRLVPLAESEKEKYGLVGAEMNLAYRYETPEHGATILVERTEPRLTARTFSCFQVKAQGLAAHCELAYQVEQSRTRRLSLLLPATTPEALSIRGWGVKDAGSEPADDAGPPGKFRRWNVLLEEASAGEVRLVVEFEQPLPEQTTTQDFALPVVRADGVVYQSGIVSVEGGEELDVQVKTSTRRADVGELAETDYQPGRRLLGAFGFVGEPPKVAIDIKRHPGYPVPPAVVERAELTTILSAEGKSQNWASFSLRTKANYLEVQLPPESELWSAELDGTRLKPQREDKSVLIGLPDGAASKTVRTLRMGYQAPVASVSLAGKVKMYAPKLLVRGERGMLPTDVPLAGLIWRLHLPSGYEVVRAQGTVVTDEVQKTEAGAVMLARGLYALTGGIHPFYGLIAAAKHEVAQEINSSIAYSRRGEPRRETSVEVATSAPAAPGQAGQADVATMTELPPDEKAKWAPIRLSPAGPAEQKIEDALKSPTQIAFVDTPLKDVIEYLKDYHKIEIQLDKKELDGLNINEDALVTKNLKGISLRSALKLLLDEMGLKYVIRNGVLLITSPTRAESEEFLTTKVYPVADLIYPVEGGEKTQANADYDSLIQTLTSTVQPKSWDQNGGQGSIAPGSFNGADVLVFSQTQEVHEEVARLLEDIRVVKRRGVKGGPISLADRSPAAKKIVAALDSPTQILFNKAPLHDVIDHLKKYHHIEIQLDKKELEGLSLNEDTLVTKNLKGVSLRSALKLLLDEMGLKYVIENDALLITSPTRAESEEFLTTTVYPVRDVLTHYRNAEGDTTSADFDSLIQTLTSTVQPKSWDLSGGQGAISPGPPGTDELIVSQTQEVHEQIRGLLAQLREARRRAGLTEDDIQVEPAPSAPPNGMQGMGGMAGGMGGMGGMSFGGGIGGGMQQQPGVISVVPAPGETRPKPRPGGGPARSAAEIAAAKLKERGTPSFTVAKPTRQSLAGVRSLKIDPQAGPPGGRVVTFHSLGVEPELTVTLAHRPRTEALAWGLALAVLLAGMAIGNRPVRRRMGFVLVVAAITTAIPLLLDNLAAAVVCNTIFFAALFLAPYYLLAGLVKWFARAAIARKHSPRRPLAPAATTAAVLVLALCGMIAAFAFAQDTQESGREPRTPVTVPDDAIILPYDPKSETGIRQADRLLVSYARYVELWNRAHPDKKIESRRAPAPYALAGAAYRTTLSGQEYIIAAGKIDIDVYADGYVTLPLGLRNAILSRAELDGKPARLSPVRISEPGNTSPGGGLVALHVSGKGRHKLEVEARLRFTRQGGWRIIDAALPTAPAATMTIEVPEGRTEVRLALPADRRTEETSKPGETIQTALGGGGELGLQWRPSVAEAQVDRGLTTDSTAILDVEEAGLRLAWNLALEFRRGQREQFSVAVPPDYLVERVNGANIRGWEVRKTETGQTVEVSLRKAAKDREQFSLQLWRAAPAGQQGKPAVFDVPQVTVADAALAGGVMTVRRSRLLDLRTVSQSGIARVELPEIGNSGAADESPLPLMPYQAYRFATLPFVLRLEAAPVPARMTADVETLLKTSEHEPSMESRILFHVEGRPIHAVEVFVPDGLEQIRVSTSGQFHWTVSQREKRRLVSVYFDAGRQADFNVVLSGTLGRTVKGSLPLPQIEVRDTDRQQGDIAVQADPAMDVEAGGLANCEDLEPAEVRAWLTPEQQTALRLALRYHRPDYRGTLSLTAREPDVVCDTISNVRVTDRAVKDTTLLRFNITRAGVRKLAFVLPGWMADARISAPMLQQKTVTKAKDLGAGLKESEMPVRVEIELQDEVMNDLRVLVENDRILPADAFCAPIPIVETGRVTRQYVTLEARARDEVKAEPKELEPLSSKQQEWKTLQALLGAGARISEAYLVPANAIGPRLTLQTVQRKEVEVAGARIGLADTVLVMDANGAYRAAIIFRLANRTEQFLEVQMPAETELWSVEVAGEQVKPVVAGPSAGADCVRVPLVKTAPGDLDYRVVLRYGGKMPALGNLGSVNFPLAHTRNIGIEQSVVRLYVPRTHQWFAFGGTMHPVKDEATVALVDFSYSMSEIDRLMQQAREGDEFTKARVDANVKNKLKQSGAGPTGGWSGKAPLDAKLQQAEKELQEMQKSPAAEQLRDNRQQLKESFGRQSFSRSRNMLKELGDNWPDANVQQPKQAAPAAQFNDQWLKKNRLDKPSAPPKPAAPAQPKAPGSSGMTPRGQAVPSVALDKMQRVLCGIPSNPGFGGMGGQSNPAPVVVPVVPSRRPAQKEVDRPAQPAPPQQGQLPNAYSRYREQLRGPAAGEKIESKDGTPRGELADLVPAIPEDAEVYRFTTPRGDVQITARTVSNNLLARLLHLAVMVGVVLVAWCAVRLARSGRLSRLSRPGTSAMLTATGVLSIVTGILPIVGLAAMIEGLMILARRAKRSP